MIKTFSHRGLKELFLTGKSSKLPQAYVKKINNLLLILNSANNTNDFDLPGLKSHKLKGPPLKGSWSINVTANFRLTFKFEDGDVYDLNYEDTH